PSKAYSRPERQRVIVFIPTIGLHEVNQALRAVYRFVRNEREMISFGRRGIVFNPQPGVQRQPRAYLPLVLGIEVVLLESVPIHKQSALPKEEVTVQVADVTLPDAGWNPEQLVYGPL